MMCFIEAKEINKIGELILPPLKRAAIHYSSPLSYVQNLAHLVLNLKVSLILVPHSFPLISSLSLDAVF